MNRKRLFRSVFLILCVNLHAFAQDPIQFEFGLRAGVPVDVNLNSYSSGAGSLFGGTSFQRPRFSFGPTFGVVVYDRVGIEFDSILKPVRGSSYFNTPFTSSTGTLRGDS